MFYVFWVLREIRRGFKYRIVICDYFSWGIGDFHRDEYFLVAGEEIQISWIFSQELIQMKRELYNDCYWIMFRIHVQLVFHNHCLSFCQHRYKKLRTRLFFRLFWSCVVDFGSFAGFSLFEYSMMVYTTSAGSLLMIVVFFSVGNLFHFSGVGMVPCHRQFCW